MIISVFKNTNVCTQNVNKMLIYALKRQICGLKIIIYVVKMQINTNLCTQNSNFRLPFFFFLEKNKN